MTWRDRGLGAVAGAIFLAFVAMGAVTLSSDPLSSRVRVHLEVAINGYLEDTTRRAAAGTLRWWDRLLLHGGVTGGGLAVTLFYPEAVAILWHGVYGDGSTLKLNASYFQEDAYLQRLIKRLKPGDNGPIGIQPSDDWRLALALNPICVVISERRIQVGHPHIKFADPIGPPVVTIVPIGRLRIRVADNLIGALNPTPFAAWAEWPMGGAGGGD